VVSLKQILDSKGQIILIIGIVMALSLYLIAFSTDFETAFRSEELRGTDGSLVLNNVNNEIRETYGSAVRNDPSYSNINLRLNDFIGFVRDESDGRYIRILLSVAVHNSTHIEAGVHNYLDTALEEVEINGYTCSDFLEHGSGCSVEFEDDGDEYTVTVSYVNTGTTKSYTKSYDGRVGDGGKHTSIFYRTELEIDNMEVVGEDNAWSKSVQ